MLAKWHEIVTMFYGLLITVWVVMPSTYRNHNLLMAGSKHFEVKWRLTRPNLSRSLFNKSHLLQNSIFFSSYSFILIVFQGCQLCAPFCLKWQHCRWSFLFWIEKKKKDGKTMPLLPSMQREQQFFSKFFLMRSTMHFSINICIRCKKVGHNFICKNHFTNWNRWQQRHFQKTRY